MNQLTRSLLPEIAAAGVVAVGPRADFPVRVLQFGEGNFLRAFIDWMIDRMNEAGVFNGSVMMVQPLPQGMGDVLNAQEGLYTLILRGMVDGVPREEPRVITSVRGCLRPDRDWARILEVAAGPELRFVFSNTTEAGIEYVPEPYTPGVAQKTYPAKLTAILDHRFRSGGRGVVVIPCELIDHNGATLRECMLRYAADWNLPEAFADWLRTECVFVNTLVDRIVAGYPRAEAESFCRRFGYQDQLLDCGEWFHLLVIEGPKELAAELPFDRIGLNVVWTDCQKPYRERKVRFLNGGHTSSVPAAYLAGFDLVDRMVADPVFGAYLRRVLFEEVFPTVDLPEAEKRAFAESIVERFLNPFANHQLISIALNSISKWKVRVLPSLLDYVRLRGELPRCLTFSLAALLAFYHAEEGADGSWSGQRPAGAYPVRDDPEKIRIIAEAWKQLAADQDYVRLVRTLLAREDFWGQDLNQIPGLTAAVAADLAAIERDGVTAVVRKLIA